MPCYATGTAEGDARLTAREASEKVTKLTRMLCSLCERLSTCPGSARLIDMDKELSEWWQTHKIIVDHQKALSDAFRRREEVERDIDRLTAECELRRLIGEDAKAMGGTVTWDAARPQEVR